MTPQELVESLIEAITPSADETDPTEYIDGVDMAVLIQLLAKGLQLTAEQNDRLSARTANAEEKARIATDQVDKLYMHWQILRDFAQWVIDTKGQDHENLLRRAQEAHRGDIVPYKPRDQRQPQQPPPDVTL